MKVMNIYPRLLIILSILLCFAGMAMAVGDDFESGSTLSGVWVHAASMNISNGNLHVSSTDGWGNNIAIFDAPTVNKAEIEWATEGDGMASTPNNGSEFGGIAITNDISISADGYLVYLYKGKIKLHEISNGLVIASPIQEISGMPASSPGSTFAVQWSRTGNSFEVILNGTSLGTLYDSAKKVDLSVVSYGGVMLYGSAAVENDVEAFIVDSVTLDETPPSSVNNLAAVAIDNDRIDLTWTATGDDGNTGTASAYDLRYSTFVISEANFNSANMASEPIPGVPGTLESASVSGLNGGTRYYFAVKVVDEAGNTSAISNIANALTEADPVNPDDNPIVLTTQVDNFNRTSLGSSWQTTGGQEIDNDELAISAGSSGWKYALMQTSGIFGAGFRFSATNSAFNPTYEYITAGLLILMDSSNPYSANGFALIRHSSKLAVYNVANGIKGSEVMTLDVTKPQPGDVVFVDIRDNGTTKALTYYLNGTAERSFVLNSSANINDTFTGVIQYNADGEKNAVDDFTYKIASENNAFAIEMYEGDGQSGQIGSILPTPISARVTNTDGEPVKDVLLDFKLVNGGAELVAQENFNYDGMIWKQVEDGILDPRQANIGVTGNPSGGAYVYYTAIGSDSRRESAVRLPIYVPDEDQSFNIWVRYRTFDNNVYKFITVVDDGADSVVVEDHVYPAAGWVWKKVSSYVPLAKGMHDIHLRAYQGDSYPRTIGWDKICVQRSDNTSTPSDKGGTGPDYWNITDSTGVAGTQIQFKNNANDDVVIQVSGTKYDGSLLENAPLVFTLDPTPGPAVSMERDPNWIDPYDTSAGVDSPPLQVIFTDAYDNLVDNVATSWTVVAGDGAFQAPITYSNTEGVAENIYRLGYQTSDHTVRASVTGISGSPVDFILHPDKVPHSMVNSTPLSGYEAVNGSMLDDSLVVHVYQADNTPFENFPVHFEIAAGDGGISTLNGDEDVLELDILTNANGNATARWRLGAVGLNELHANGEGLIGSPIIFTANGLKGEPSLLVKESGDDQTGYTGMPLAEDLTVKLTDLNGFPIPETKIYFEIIKGNPDAFIDFTGNRTKEVYTSSEGTAHVSLNMGSQIDDEHQVRATAISTTIAPVVFTSRTSTQKIAQTLEYVSGNHQTAQVLQELTSSFVVRALDPYRSPVSGQSVTFRVMTGGGVLEGYTEKTAVTNENGEASALLTLGTEAGDSVHVVHAIAYRKDKPMEELDGSPVIFKASGIPQPAHSIAKVDSSDLQEGEVGRTLNREIAIKVKDMLGNGVKDHGVTFDIQGEGGYLVTEDSETKKLIVNTDNFGIAQVIWKMPNTPGNVYLRVTANNSEGAPLLDSPLNFTAKAKVGPAEKLVRVSADSVLEGQVYEELEDPLIVRVVDRLDNPISNYIVYFQVTDTNNSLINNGLQEIEVPTATNGEASINWQLGQKSGLAVNHITASAAVGNEDSSTVVFKATGIPDEPYRLIPDTTFDHRETAGTLLSDPIKVKIVDQYSNGVPMQPVDFLIVPDAKTGNAGYIDEPGVTEKTVSTNAEGFAIIHWGLGKMVGSLNNSMKAEAVYKGVHLVDSPSTFKATGLTGPAYRLVKVTDDSTKDLSATIGNPLGDQLKVKIVDLNGNPIARYDVKFQVRSHAAAKGGTLDGKVDTEKTVQTNDNGVAAVTFELGLEAGVKNNKVHVSSVGENGLDLIGSPTQFLISGLATDATQMVKVDGDNQTGSVGHPLQREISIKITDDFQNASEGQSVQFKILPREGLTLDMLGSFGNSTRIDTTVISDSVGVAKVIWRLGNKVGDYFVEALSYSGADTLVGGPIYFKATATSDITNADSSFLTIETDTLQVSSGTPRATVVVNLRDQFNNPVYGKAVSFIPEDKDVSVTIENSLSDENGQVFGYVFSNFAGTKLVTAKDLNSGVAINDSVYVTFIPAAAANIRKALVDDGDNQSQNIGTVLEKELRVEVTDMFGNTIRNHAVTFQPETGSNAVQIVSNVPVMTDSMGVAIARVRLGSVQGLYKILAKSTGISNTVSFSANAFTPSALSTLLKVSGDNQTAAPGERAPESLKVRVYDDHNNFVYNASISIKIVEVNSGGQILDQQTKKSNEYGEVSFQVAVGTEIGPNYFNVYATDSQSLVNTIFHCETGSPGSNDAEAMTIVSGNSQVGKVGQTLPQPLQVIVTDEYGNGVNGYDVTFIVASDNSVQGVGHFAGGVATTTSKTNNDGIASVYYTMGTKAGINKVTARAMNLAPNELTFSLTGEAAEPRTMELVEDTNNQVGEMGKELLLPISVLLKDKYQNPAAGGHVKFARTDSYSEITSNPSVISGTDGYAKATWRLGPKPNSYINKAVATASLNGQSFRIDFQAQGDNSNWPVLQAPDAMDMWEGQFGSFEVTATDEDGDLLDIRVDQETMPEGASFTKSTSNRSVFQWTPGANVVQSPATFTTFTIDFEVVETGKTGRDKKSVVITVNNQNQAPILLSKSPSLDTINRTSGLSIINFNITVSDPDPNDELSYTWFVDNAPVSYSNTYLMTVSQFSATETHTIVCVVQDLAGAKVTETWVLSSTSKVELSNFASRFEPYKGVLLDWETSDENGNTGFNVLRSVSETGNYARINDELIPAEEDGKYAYNDNAIKAGIRYWYKIEDVSVSGVKTQHGPVQAESSVPTEFALKQNYPNPFNPTTTIRFELPEMAFVNIEIYNIMGQKVCTLVEREVDAGYHEMLWNGKNALGNIVSSGVYIYRIHAGDFSKSFKMSLIR